MYGFALRRAFQRGLWLYGPVAFVAWLIAGELAGWHKGAIVGATVALLGVALMFTLLALAGAPAGDLFQGSFLFCAVPIGLLVWGNHGHGQSWAWTILWLFVAGLVVRVLVGFSRWVSRYGNTT